MIKLVIADDERNAVKEIERMLDWDSLGITLLGAAYDGEQLKKLIDYAAPDIVITDVVMPFMTGLEVMSRYLNADRTPQFILISRHREYAYVQEAISMGAADYLTKPLDAPKLEKAVQRALQQIELQRTAILFRELPEHDLLPIADIGHDSIVHAGTLSALIHTHFPDTSDLIFAGLCAGLHPDQQTAFLSQPFSRYNRIRFAVFHELTSALTDRHLGFVIRHDEQALHLIGVFPESEKDSFVTKYVEPICRQVSMDHGVRIGIGIGQIAESVPEILQSYKNARFAFGLLHFESDTDIIRIDDIHRDYHVSFEDYQEDAETAFRAVIGNDPEVLNRIDRVMDDIEAIHYGNWQAALMRTMLFTGDVGIRLDQYHLLDMDFYDMQDRLQEAVIGVQTMSGLKSCIHSHYESLIRRIRDKARARDKVLIEEVKDYIRKNYNRDLTVMELSEIACVSPNYFSAMFKKETGQNYKAFLTQIRMEKALALLEETDAKTYEISEQVGYNNVRRFADAFKQLYQVSPMEYRKMKKRP